MGITKLKMKSLFLVFFYIQNGIIAASPHAMSRQHWWMTILLDLQEEIRELEDQGQKFETLAQTLMDENKNLKGQIETRVKEYADLEEKMAVQTDQIRVMQQKQATMQTDQTKKFEMMQQQLSSMEKQLTDKIENLQKRQLETQEQTEINTNILNVPTKISINVWDCSFMCEEELSNWSLTKSVSKPCSRNRLCGSYHHVENYNGRPVYKQEQSAPYNKYDEIYLYYQTHGLWCLTSGYHYRDKSDSWHMCRLFLNELEHGLESERDVRKISGSWSESGTEGLPEGFWIVTIKEES